MASTVMVNLKKDWFGPDGSLYQARDNPHEFPAEYADDPEKSEKETDEEWKARKARQPFAVLPSSAEIVEKAKTVVTLQNTANGEQLLVPTAVEGDVSDVGGALDDKGIEQPSQSTASAEKGAEAHNVQVGGVPRKSGPLPAAATDKKK